MDDVRCKKVELKVILPLLMVLLPLVAQAQSKQITINGVPFVMKYVQGGTFTMGAVNPQGADADEFPTHQETVKDFYIGETEVTQALWKAVMKKGRPKVSGDNYPMERLSYNDCLAFINRLNQLTGLQFRLPTEVEWEYAARGGRKSKGYLYAGSNDPEDVAWTRRDQLREIAYWHKPVKTRKPNEIGLFDMSGSVWEWCYSEYEEYDKSKSLPFLTKWFRQRFMVIRGGSFNNNVTYCRVSNRYLFAKTRRKPTVGMRLVLEP
jgi:formylglycine-generating enzyme required for sulfatase activity